MSVTPADRPMERRLVGQQRMGSCELRISMQRPKLLRLHSSGFVCAENTRS